jgi:hypothetical protein
LIIFYYVARRSEFLFGKKYLLIDMPWGQICGSITFSNSEAGSEILNDEYTSGLLDFNFSQEEIDITKDRRYACSFSASVSGDNLETCKWTFFGILNKVLVAVEEPTVYYAFYFFRLDLREWLEVFLISSSRLIQNHHLSIP